MEQEELSRTLKGQAVTLGLCDKWTNEWGKPDMQGLIDKYKNGIDFAIKCNYPTLDFIKENFDKELLHKNFIWIDEQVEHYKKNGTIIINGSCTGTITCSSFNANRIYVRHDSEITINCDGMSKVFVDCHDNAKVHINQSQASSVYVYLHDNSTETHIGEIKLRKK